MSSWHLRAPDVTTIDFALVQLPQCKIANNTEQFSTSSELARKLGVAEDPKSQRLLVTLNCSLVFQGR